VLEFLPLVKTPFDSITRGVVSTYMETILAVLAFAAMALGFLGSIFPILPGPPLSFAGLLLLQLSGYGGFSSAFLWIWAAITAIVTVGDNFLPAWMTKQFGGSRYAVWGSVLGIIAGIFLFPPVGLIFGPFLGALAGELIVNRSDGHTALKAALGAFLAFIVGTGIKLIVCAVMVFYAIKAVL
jgi:uncharacterized protein YqgC (DUF456 family)